jgi:hypothetical protein
MFLLFSQRLLWASSCISICKLLEIHAGKHISDFVHTQKFNINTLKDSWKAVFKEKSYPPRHY